MHATTAADEQLSPLSQPKPAVTHAQRHAGGQEAEAYLE